MHEPKILTAARHAILLVFVGLSLWPVLDVVSISLRPGNRLRTTNWQLIPDGATLDSYRELFTEQPFLRWLGNSLLVSGTVTVFGVALASVGGYAFSRFRFVGRQAMMT